MPFKSFIQLTLQSAFKVKTQLLRIIIMLSAGVAAIFFMISYSNTIKVETFRRFHSEGTDSFSVIRRQGSGPIGPAQNRKLNLNAAEYLSYDSDFILGAAPEIRLSQTITFRDLSFATFVSGIQQDFFPVLNLKLLAGRRFSRFDQGKPFCLLGYRVYQRLCKRYSKDIINRSIHLGQNVFRIIGVLAAGKTSQSEFSIDETIFVPFLTLMQYTEHAEITKITLKANPNRPIPDVTDYIKASIERCLGDATIYEINNQQIFLQTITEQVNLFSFIFGIVGSIALILGSISLLKLIIYLNFERNNVFNLLSDTGVKARYIKLQLIIEPLVIALMSGLIGVLLGLFIVAQIVGQHNWVPVYSVNTILISLAIITVLGLLIGLYPALSIKKSLK